MTELQRQIIPMLNGINSFQEIAEHVAFLLKSGLAAVDPKDEANKDSPQYAVELARRTVNDLAARCLLVA